MYWAKRMWTVWGDYKMDHVKTICTAQRECGLEEENTTMDLVKTICTEWRECGLEKENTTVYGPCEDNIYWEKRMGTGRGKYYKDHVKNMDWKRKILYGVTISYSFGIWYWILFAIRQGNPSSEKWNLYWEREEKGGARYNISGTP